MASPRWVREGPKVRLARGPQRLRLPLATPMNERLLVAVAHSKAAVPLAARAGHTTNVRFLVSPSQSGSSQIHPLLKSNRDTTQSLALIQRSLVRFRLHLTANICRRDGLDPVQHATHRLPPARTKLASWTGSRSASPNSPRRAMNDAWWFLVTVI